MLLSRGMVIDVEMIFLVNANNPSIELGNRRGWVLTSAKDLNKRSRDVLGERFPSGVKGSILVDSNKRPIDNHRMY
jgi:hypothetical protein